MVGVNDAARGVNDLFLDLAKPFWGSRRVTIHLNVLIPVHRQWRTGKKVIRVTRYEGTNKAK